MAVEQKAAARSMETGTGGEEAPATEARIQLKQVQKDQAADEPKSLQWSSSR